MFVEVISVDVSIIAIAARTLPDTVWIYCRILLARTPSLRECCPFRGWRKGEVWQKRSQFDNPPQNPS